MYLEFNDLLNNEIKKKIYLIKYHFNQIYKIYKKKFNYGCGSYLFDGQNYQYQKTMIEKQKLLYNLSKTSSHILEIGVYMGHSMLIMLLANPKANITCIDIDPTYSIPSVSYLRKEFPNAKINLIINDSVKALKKINKKFDLIHIDGNHQIKKVYLEFLLSLKKFKKNEVNLLFDDIENILPIKRCILKCFNTKTLQPKSNYTNFYVKIKKNLEFRKQLIFFKKEFQVANNKNIIRLIYYLSFYVYKIIFKSNFIGRFLIKNYINRFKDIMRNRYLE